MRKYRLLPAGLAVVALAGCVDTPEEQQAMNTAAGALIGAGLGMAVSSDDDELKGALIGGGVGALIGHSLSKGSMVGQQSSQVETSTSGGYTDGALSDERSRAIHSAHDYAMREALDTGVLQRWRSFGVTGTVYPTSRWEEYGQTCRGYDSIWTDSSTGQRGNFSGQACRQPNGFWRII